MHSILFASCFFFTVKIFYSPAYILPLFLSLIYILKINSAKINKRSLIESALLLSLLLLISKENILHPAFILSLTSILLLPLVNTKKFINDTLYKLPKSYKILIYYFSLEAFFRIFFPQMFSSDPSLVNDYLSGSEENSFYAYKFGSFAFVDSNLVALCLLIILTNGINLLKLNKINKYYVLANIILILLTLSRSAYIGLALILVIFYQWDKIKFYAGPIAIFITLFFILYSDASLSTKFTIYENAISILESSSIKDFIYGKGFGWFISEYELAAHSIIVQSIIEGGIIYTLIFFYLCKKYGAFNSKKDFATFIAILIPSLSVSIYVIFPGWLISCAINRHINNLHQ